MKSIVFIGTFALVASSLVTSAYAQKSKREQAVAACVAQAQQQIPPSGNPNDPGYNNRYNVYASCMKTKGLKP